MTKEEIIEYLYENNVRGDLAIEQMAEDLANTPQTDCETCKWGEWYRNGRNITNMDDECGGCCSWNNKWQPREPQTDCAGCEDSMDVWAETKPSVFEKISVCGLDDTDCPWK